jgi:putative ABC transport system permease protein
MTIVVRGSGGVSDLPSTVRSAVHSLDKDQPVWSVKPLAELVSVSIARQRFAMLKFGVFSSAALLLSMIGTYGVMSYSVGQRTSEIGIRMALRAPRANMLNLIFMQGGRLVALGLACGVAGALVLTRLISAMLFGVSPHDPLTFAAISILLALAAAVACLIPARRATNVDPAVALRAG